MFDPAASQKTPLVAVTGSLGTGGSTTFLLNLGRGFGERSLSLVVISLSDEHPMADDFAAAGISVQIVSRRRLIYEDRTREAFLLAAAHRPAAVLACLGSESFEVLRVLPRNVVRLGVIQSDDPGPYQMARAYAPWLDGMVGVSEKIRQSLSADSPYQNIRIESIPYGIHFAGPSARVPRDPAAPLRLIYVGRMIETQKRISRLIELAKVLAARQVKFEFTFAGAGPELDAAKVQLRGNGNVRFLGEIPNREIAAVLRAQDVFVLLSDFEGLPLSLLEAMGEGVVPVVSDLESGMREVVTAEIGIRVPVGDVAAAADAVMTLATFPGRLSAMSAAATRLARERYSAVGMADRYVGLIRELSRGAAVWPADVEVPAPLHEKRRWLYRGFFRRARRILKGSALFGPAKEGA
ncbi:MAG TPA: glycosyltransferase family 4 protein [Verrucomicrobiae bacterium]|nr:glycosyltransferase family 4 protein [Verrucomicrobiae bacterium]